MSALRYSRQREAIKNFLMTRRDHPTADVVYQSVRNEFPNISLGTVYRNLTLLAQLGEISRLRFDDGVDHFDYDTSPHCHFICRECGSVLDMETDILPGSAELEGRYYDGNLIAGHVTWFYGSCVQCCRAHHDRGSR